jgi:uncharacterized membrane protein YccC
MRTLSLCISRRSRLVALAALLVVTSGLGCGRRDPLERKVNASTATAFSNWQAQVASGGNADNRRRVPEALQEIKAHFVAEREMRRAKGQRVGTLQDVDDIVRATVDGHSVRDVLRLGYGFRLRRLRDELLGLETAISQNAQLITKPGDTASRQHLDGLRERQEARVRTYREQLDATERELAALDNGTSPSIALPTLDRPLDAASVDVLPERRD